MNRLYFLCLIVIMVFVAWPVSAEIQSSENPDKNEVKLKLSPAVELFNQKLFTEAEAVFIVLLKDYPANQEISLWAAMNYLELKKYDEALKCIESARDVNPGSLDLMKMHAKINTIRKDYSEAEDILEELIELNQNDIAIWQMLSFVNLSQKDFGDAIEATDKAIQLDPKSMNSYLYKGYSLIGRKKFVMAITVFDEALKIEPENIAIKTGKDYAVKAMKELKGSRKVSQPVQEELYGNVNATHPDGI